jgi:hypothetical protein
LDWQRVKDEFAVRYYHWSGHDFAREIDDDFPFLRALHNRAAMRFMENFRLLDAADAQALTAALVKHAHRQALALSGDEISSAEESLVRDFSQAILIPSVAEASFKDANGHGHGTGKIDRNQLTERIKQELRGIFPYQPENWGPYDWCYRIPMGDWVVQTYIDAGSHEHKLLYDHAIISQGDARLRLEDMISILSWFGITQKTTWDYVEHHDVVTTARSLAHVCAHFVQAVPQLLPGL